MRCVLFLSLSLFPPLFVSVSISVSHSLSIISICIPRFSSAVRLRSVDLLVFLGVVPRATSYVHPLSAYPAMSPSFIHTWYYTLSFLSFFDDFPPFRYSAHRPHSWPLIRRSSACTATSAHARPRKWARRISFSSACNRAALSSISRCVLCVCVRDWI